MEKLKEAKKYPSLVSERFGHGKKHYFIDVKKAVNDSHFILVTSSERYGDNQYHRQTVQLWEEDLAFFMEALSMVLTEMTCGDGPQLFSRAPMEVVKDATGMKALASEDRPREKLHASERVRCVMRSCWRSCSVRGVRSFQFWTFVKRSCFR